MYKTRHLQVREVCNELTREMIERVLAGIKILQRVQRGERLNAREKVFIDEQMSNDWWEGRQLVQAFGADVHLQHDRPCVMSERANFARGRT